MLGTRFIHSPGVRVYNFTVSKTHTYFVSSDLSAAALWVHNSGGSSIKKPINSGLAGKNHGTSGVPFKKNGYPDFSGYAIKTVKIKQTGNRRVDEAAANKAAGLKETHEDYIWHHHEDMTTMELVPKHLHQKTAHTGGVANLKNQ